MLLRHVRLPVLARWATFGECPQRVARAEGKRGLNIPVTAVANQMLMGNDKKGYTAAPRTGVFMANGHDSDADGQIGQQVAMVCIDAERAGQRLDNFLMSQLKGVPKSHIYRIIRSGEVRINKGRAKPTSRLEAGDQVRIPPVRVAQPGEAAPVSHAMAEKLSRSLLYEDDSLLIYNKPAGLAVHGGSGISLGLIETLRSLYPEEKNLELVHRLDRDTSGLIMVARKRQFLRRVQRLLQDDGVKKRYWLLCRGFKGGARSMDAPLLKMMQGSERIVRVSREGKASLTHFSLKERFAQGEWLEAELATGRTHQIRVHAQHGGFPLYGDPKYGDPRANDWMAAQGVKRMCLHARQLVFRHPDSGKLLDISAPLDEDFEQALAALRAAR